MLYLFDIDGTLVDTGGAGIRALEETGHRIFGGSGPPLDLAGSTDLGIVASMHEHFRVTPAPATVAAFFEVYHERLEWNLANGGFPGRVLPGVVTVLNALALKTGAALGLLTGNTATGAAAKMRHFNLAHFFPVGAYGCDHADRNRLGPIALERARAHFAREFSSGETLIIGDTPNHESLTPPRTGEQAYAGRFRPGAARRMENPAGSVHPETPRFPGKARCGWRRPPLPCPA